jgi:two-component system, LytTR family, response regulator
MEEIKVIIIDDEAPARDIIRHYLKAHPSLKIVEECSDGFAGLKAIKELNPDLVFLDIQMPRLTGFEMLEVMDEKPLIIFTTAYDQFAIRAFELNAIDYLMKPVSSERFSAAVNRAVEKLAAGRELIARPSSILENSPDDTPSITRVVVRKGNAINIIPVENIRYIEAQDDYVMVYFNGGKALKQQRMKFFETSLPPAEFTRIHRSYIVRIAEIAKIEPYGKENYIAILKSGDKLPVSRAGYKHLREELGF